MQHAAKFPNDINNPHHISNVRLAADGALVAADATVILGNTAYAICDTQLSGIPIDRGTMH